MNTATVSPDGRYVAAMILKASQEASGKWNYAESVQVYEPALSKVIGRVDIPSVALIEDASLFGYAFVSYCNNGKKLVAFDKIGTLYVLNGSSYQVESKVNIGDMRAHPGQAEDIRVTMTCSASNNLVAVSAYGGRFGWGLVRLFDLTSGNMISELSQNASSAKEFGAISLSPDGSKLAILLENPKRTAIQGPNVEIRETKHLTLVNQFTTGDAPNGLTFSGESEVLTAQGQATGRDSSRRVVQLWNVESGKEVKRYSDASADVDWPISSSADGTKILGYIPTYRECRFCNGLEGRRDVKEQRFAVWNKATGEEIYRSEPFRPIVEPLGPQPVLSQNGTTAMVYWPDNVITPRLFPLP